MVNRWLEAYLRCLTGRKPKQWPTWLSWAEYWYNTNYHSSLKTTPFRALYGREPVIIRGDVHHSLVEEVDRSTADRNDMLRVLQEQLLKAQERMRVQANRHRRQVELEVGDMVYLKMQPYKMKSLAKRINQKLSPRYYGPYEVEEKIGAVVYRLKLPEDSKVHPVFHVSLLKKVVAPTSEFQPLPSCLNEDWMLEAVPEEIIAMRKNDCGENEVIIKWKQLPAFQNSWELTSKIKEAFPGLLLEGKEISEGGGNDKFSKGKVYVGKKKGGQSSKRADNGIMHPAADVAEVVECQGISSGENHNEE